MATIPVPSSLAMATTAVNDKRKGLTITVQQPPCKRKTRVSMPCFLGNGLHSIAALARFLSGSAVAWDPLAKPTAIGKFQPGMKLSLVNLVKY